MSSVKNRLNIDMCKRFVSMLSIKETTFVLCNQEPEQFVQSALFVSIMFHYFIFLTFIVYKYSVVCAKEIPRLSRTIHFC